MLLSRELIEDRMRFCVSDLRENGIDLDRADESAVREVVEANLDYFQSMLGFDSDVRAVIALIKRQKRHGLA